MTQHRGVQLGFREDYREFQGNDAAFSMAFFGNFQRKNQRNLTENSRKTLVKSPKRILSRGSILRRSTGLKIASYLLIH